MSRELLKLYKERWAAERKFVDGVARELPFGRPINWERGGNVLAGEVLDSHGDRVKVRNCETGKTYHVSVYDVLRAQYATDTILGFRSRKATP
jgi:hypothetical protein